MSKGNGQDVVALLAQVRAGVTGIATTALGAVTQLTKEVNSLTRSFVEAIRPDVVQRFDLASRDLTAVVGQFLTPVMERATVVIRLMGDQLDGIYRTMKGVISGGFALFDQMLKDFTPVVKELVAVWANEWVGVYQDVLKLAKELAPVFKQVLDALTPVVKTFIQLGGENVRSSLAVLSALTPGVAGIAKAVAGLLSVVTVPLRVMGEAVQLVAKAAAPLAALFGEVQSVLGELWGELAELGGDLLSALVDLVKELARAVFTLLDPLKDVVLLLAQGLVGAIRQVVEWVRWAINAFREVIGLPRKQFEKAPGLDGNSTGKAVQRAEFLSPDDLYRKVALSTASLGRTDPVSNIDKTVSTIAATLADMSRAAQQTAANTRPGQPDPRAADMWRRQEINRG